MKILSNALLLLLDVASMLGLKDNDLENAKDFLTHHEFGLCFDTIITQMYEYDIEIDNELYESIAKIGKTMNLPKESYSFMKELIRDKYNIPKPVKDELAKILKVLSSENGVE